MNILIISNVYYPEPIPKIHELAVDLHKKGHKVLVLTAFPSYPEGKVYKGYRQRLYSWEIINGVRILRVWSYCDHSRSFIRRVVSYLSFAFFASIFGPLFCGSPQVMYVRHPPLTAGLAAMLIGLTKRVPFVYDVQDLWPESILVSGIKINRLSYRLLRLFENIIHRKASALIVPSLGYKRNLEGKGVESRKINVIYNWADGEIFYPVQPDLGLAKTIGMSGRFNIVFAGNIGLVQALSTVIEAAEKVKDVPDIQFVSIGDGADRPRLETLVKEKRLNNVIFLERHKVEEMAGLLALADVLLVHLKDKPIFEITIPSKTQAYMACGKPILMAIKEEAQDVISKYKAGVVCSPENPGEMVDAVRHLYSLSVEERERMGVNARKAFLKHYERGILVEEYISLLLQVADGLEVRR